MNLVTRVDHEKTVTLITLQSRFIAKLKNIILIFGQLSLWSKQILFVVYIKGLIVKIITITLKL